MQLPVYPGRGDRPDWNNPSLIQRGCLPPRADFIPFPDQNSCRQALSAHRRYLSPSVLVLDGDWDYRYYPSILQLPENILSFRAGFSKKPVPALEPVQPLLTDEEQLPFPDLPPFIPPEQPVLVYRRSCRLPLLWSGLRKRLVLQGIRSACHLFVNSKAAGFFQGSGLRAEFDITSLLHDGDNEIFLLIYPFSSASYLESIPSSPWYGLVRAVQIEALPAMTIHDLTVKTAYLNEESAWRLDLSFHVTSCRIAVEQPLVRIMLRQGEDILHEGGWTVTMRPVAADSFGSPVQTEGRQSTSILLPDVRPWQAEDPALYDLFVSLDDRQGRELVSLHQAIGFREISWQDQQLFLNGQPIQMRAVRWNLVGQPDPTTDLAGTIQLLRSYKSHNFNTIYFQHEPADPILLDLCDIYGLYVISEAPFAPKSNAWLTAMQAEDPGLAQVWGRDRLLRLIRRDKNHACVLLWSCGIFLEDQEQLGPELAGLAYNLANLVRQEDSTRALHGIDLADLGHKLDRWQTGQTSSNWLQAAPGDNHCYFEQGGADELLPALAHQMRPFDFVATDAPGGRFLLVNQTGWSEAGAFRIDWVILRQGYIIKSAELELAWPGPGQKTSFTLDYEQLIQSDDAEYLIRFTVRWAEDKLWCFEDETVFGQEFIIQARPGGQIRSSSGGRLRLESERHHLIVSGPRFWLVFNKLLASLESWRIGDKEIMSSRSNHKNQTSFIQPAISTGLRPCLLRQIEPLDEVDWPLWQKAGYNQLFTYVTDIKEGCDGRSAIIDILASLAPAGRPAAFYLTLRYEMSGRGKIRIFASLKPAAGQLPPPCFGLAFNPAAAFEQLNWFGQGPQRVLSRLPRAGESGHYTATIKELCSDQSPPGVFYNTRRLILRDSTDFGLMLTSEQKFAFNVLRENNRQETGPTLHIYHQASLACRTQAEPYKLLLELDPLV